MVLEGGAEERLAHILRCTRLGGAGLTKSGESGMDLVIEQPRIGGLAQSG